MEGFDQSAKQYERMIHSIIHSLHIYKNKEEFYQVGLIALWEAKERFDPEKGGFTSYAFSFIKGRIQYELTKSKNYEDRNVCCDHDFWKSIDESYGLHSPEVSFLLSHCENLTANQKKWLLYTCLEGLSIREIAAKENVSPSAVKAWRKAARKKLKDFLLIST